MVGARFSPAHPSRAFCAAGTAAWCSLLPQAAYESGTELVKATHGWSAGSVAVLAVAWSKALVSI